MTSPAIDKIHQTWSTHFADILLIESRYLVLYGGRGSGKSEAVARKIFFRCWYEGGHRVLITRKIRRSLKDSALKVMLLLLSGSDVKYTYNKTDLFIRFRGQNGEWNELLFYGLDDPEKLKSLKGITMVWIEEATDLSKADFIEVDLILREPSKFYKQLMMSFNPDETKALWLKEMFFGEKPDFYTGAGKKRDSFLHHSSIMHNPVDTVVEEYVDILDDLDDEALTKIYKHGIWAAPKGRIFFWPEEPLPSEDADWYDDIIYGNDFGFSVNENAYFKIWRKGLKFWVKELIYELGLTTPQLAKEIKANLESDIEAETYCDSAEPKAIQELIDNGINALPSEKGPDSIEYSYDLLLSLDICIVEGTSHNLLDETRTHKWKEDRFGNPTGKPVDFKNHGISAVRYAIYTHYLKYLRTGQVEGKVSYQGASKPKAKETEEAREARLLQQAKNHTASRRQHPQALNDKKEEESRPTMATTGGKGDARKGKVYTPW